VKESLGEQARQQWLAATGAFVRTRPQVKALAYVDAERTDGDASHDTSLPTAKGSPAVVGEPARGPYVWSAR